MKQTLENLMMTALSPQPRWETGEPDKITGIVGGFKDGLGREHPVPAGLRGYKSVNAIKGATGEWFWEAIPE